MGRWLRVLAVFGVVVLAAGCTAFMPDPEVRFENASVDWVILYGIRVGEAEHLGSIRPNNTTRYYRTTAGSYNVELKTESGVWISVTTGPKELKRGKQYTVRMTGSTTTGADFILLED